MLSVASAVFDAVDCGGRSGGWTGSVVEVATHRLDSMSFD